MSCITWATLTRFQTFQFLEIIPRGLVLLYFSHKFDGKELILRYYRTEIKKFTNLKNDCIQANDIW